MKQMADIWWEFSKIPLIALAFRANMPNQWGNNRNFVFWPYIRHNIIYKAWSTVGFYDENDEISKNAIAFTADEPKIWGK